MGQCPLFTPARQPECVEHGFPDIGPLSAKDRHSSLIDPPDVFKKAIAMRHSDHYARKSPFDVLRALFTQIATNGLLYGIFKSGRQIWAMTRKRTVVGCNYCGSAISGDAENCTNCGAGAPPAPPAAAQAEPKTASHVATVALWWFGGFLGFHCYPAGRPLRGLIYFFGAIGTFFVAMSSLDPKPPLGALTGFGSVTMMIGLTLLWAFDGVQIMRGRFL